MLLSRILLYLLSVILCFIFFTVLDNLKFNTTKSFIDPITKNNIVPSKVTKIALQNIVRHLSGYVLGDSSFTTLCGYEQLTHSYVVLNDNAFFEQYKNRVEEMKKKGWKPSKSTVPARFLQATSSRFQYVTASYIVDCFNKNQLLCPSKYALTYDTSMFVKGRSAAGLAMTRHMQRCREPASSQRAAHVLARTALKRSRRKARKNEEKENASQSEHEHTEKPKRKHKTLKTVQPGVLNPYAMVSRTAYRLYMRNYSESQGWLHKNIDGKVDVSRLNSYARSIEIIFVLDNVFETKEMQRLKKS